MAGLLTSLVGIGGGFVVVPALVHFVSSNQENTIGGGTMAERTTAIVGHVQWELIQPLYDNVLLVAPGQVLNAFGIVDASFSVLSLTRVLAGLAGILAAAVYPLPDLPMRVRGRALMTVAISYALLSALTVIQQVAIWSSTAGLLLSGMYVVYAAAFAWLAMSERKVLVAVA